MEEKGLRYNDGKPCMSLLPPLALEEVAKVLTYGKQKYAAWNWLKGLDHMSIVDSMERHLSAWKKGEDIDSESGLLHASHMATNAVMLIEMILLRPDLNDRPTEFYKQLNLKQ